MELENSSSIRTQKCLMGNFETYKKSSSAHFHLFEIQNFGISHSWTKKGQILGEKQF
jgi:hypothetical protein